MKTMKIIIITLIVCSLMQMISSSTVNATNILDDECLHKEDLKCPDCMADKCAFWFCRLGNDEPTNVTLCQNPSLKTPNTTCTSGGKWHRLEKPEKCPSGPTPSNSTTTSTTTTSPETTTSTTSKPSTTSPGNPHIDDSGKLTGWTIVGIVCSSLLVVLVLVLVAWKKVRKLYAARNPYRTFQ